MEDFLNDISGSVDKLVQISRAIKNSSTSNWSIKAEAYEEWEDELGVLINKSERFKVFVGILLEHRYRDLHVDVRNRLRESISRCHRRIAYQKKCQPKLSYEGAKMVTENQGRSVAMLSVLPTPGSKAAQQLIQLATAPTAPIAQSQRGSYMSASTLSPEFNPFGSENRSSVSSGSSYSRLQANQEEELPPPPPLKGNQRYFQCPYCFIQLPRKRAKRRAWMYVESQSSIDINCTQLTSPRLANISCQISSLMSVSSMNVIQLAIGLKMKMNGSGMSDGSIT